MITELGYPPILIIAVLVSGFLLAIVRPYPVFLFAVVALTAGNADMFNATRLEALGPYLNLGDACLVVALAASVFDLIYRKKPPRVPKLVFMLLLVVGIGVWQSFLLLGMTYESLRAFRWALELPLSFFLAANLVDTTARAKQLLTALLVGAVLGAVQHLGYVWLVQSDRTIDMGSLSKIRTIAYSGGGISVAFLLAGLVGRPRVNWAKSALYLTVGALFLASVLFGQTRSVWIAAVAAIPCILILFQRRDHLLHMLRVGAVASVLAISAVGFSHLVAPSLNATEIVATRVGLLWNEERDVGTRARSFEVEMDHWFQGSLIFGRGLYFYQTLDLYQNLKHLAEIAFGHMGYVTYLSQLGLVGLFVYGIYLPLSVFRDGRHLWRHGGRPELQYMGLLAGASIIFLSIMFMMSSSFLQLGYLPPGTLYGAAWRLTRI